MTELVYLTDSYLKELKTRVVSCVQKGKIWEIILEKTIFYPQGGGQLSDQGEILGRLGKAKVKHVRMQESEVIHECSLEGELINGEEVICQLDWDWRWQQMLRHSAGHLVHEAVMQLFPQLKPLRADHGKHLFIEYEGTLPIDKKYEIEKLTDEIIVKDLPFETEMVSYEELIKKVNYIAGPLPKNKPLRILQIGDYPPIPDGGTQVKSSGELSEVVISKIENLENTVRVYYEITSQSPKEDVATVSATDLIGQLLELQRTILSEIEQAKLPEYQLKIKFLGPKSELAKLTSQVKNIPQTERQQAGIVANQVKKEIERVISSQLIVHSKTEEKQEFFDVTMPGIRPPEGHLHIVTQAISEITRIFEKIGFTRVHHPEIEWDWYAFESLNMPHSHPASDEWETFYLQYSGKPGNDYKKQKIVLTPHTSSGQVREMEKRKLPIRMINIAKCYRRQSDISHVPMFHQFEGMYIDKNVSIGHLKGFIDYFVKHFFGPERKSRLRPFHFQFTEPSFEVDISCANCEGKGCRLCKEGWLELAGSGMIHPVVLKNGGIDPNKYSGFAIGWGIERTYMMKSGTKLDDIRLLYGNDVSFLEQF